MLWSFKRDGQTIICEVRHSSDDCGFELVVTGQGHSHTERFQNVRTLLSREHELATAWRALGWRLDCGRADRGR